MTYDENPAQWTVLRSQIHKQRFELCPPELPVLEGARATFSPHEDPGTWKCLYVWRNTHFRSFMFSKLDGFKNACSLSFRVLVLAAPPPAPTPSVGGNDKAYSLSKSFSSFPACLPTTWRPLHLSCPFIPNSGQDKRDNNETPKRTNAAAC